MNISVIGCGRVGLVVGVCLAKLGNTVTMVDIDGDKVAAIRNQTSYLCEAELGELLKQVHVNADTDYRGVAGSDIILICVDTPLDETNSSPSKSIMQAAEQLAEEMKRKENYYVVVVRSTVAPGTTEEVIIPILGKWGRRAGTDFGMCVNPEFLRVGNAVQDFMHPARVIIGEYDKKSGDTLSGLYHGFNVPIQRTNLRTAEMIKLASNAFLSTKISFINEIGNLCKQLGIDTYEVAKGMGFDERIGSKFLNAGIGFGGSCLPKDLTVLVRKAKEMGYIPRVLEEVLHLNKEQPLRMLGLLKRHIPVLEGKVIGILGLAFKPGTDDVKESKAIEIVEALLDEGAQVRVYDPKAMPNFKKLFPHQIEYSTPEGVLTADAVLILTDWDEFNNLNYRNKIVIDGRRILKAKEARVYEGICW
jgi:UDPglucose 6-dehydrogenase